MGYNAQNSDKCVEGKTIQGKLHSKRTHYLQWNKIQKLSHIWAKKCNFL